MDWNWGDLKLEGYIGGQLRVTREFSGRGVDRLFEVKADETALLADGADVTRVVVKVTDEFGNVRPYANDPILFKLEGPAELIGDNPFALFGGVGAVWVKAKDTAGEAVLTATHPRLGSRSVHVTFAAVKAEEV